MLKVCLDHCMRIFEPPNVCIMSKNTFIGGHNISSKTGISSIFCTHKYHLLGLVLIPGLSSTISKMSFSAFKTGYGRIRALYSMNITATTAVFPFGKLWMYGSGVDHIKKGTEFYWNIIEMQFALDIGDSRKVNAKLSCDIAWTTGNTIIINFMNYCHGKCSHS